MKVTAILLIVLISCSQSTPWRLSWQESAGGSPVQLQGNFSIWTLRQADSANTLRVVMGAHRTAEHLTVLECQLPAQQVFSLNYFQTMQPQSMLLQVIDGTTTRNIQAMEMVGIQDSTLSIDGPTLSVRVQLPEQESTPSLLQLLLVVVFLVMLVSKTKFAYSKLGVFGSPLLVTPGLLVYYAIFSRGLDLTLSQAVCWSEWQSWLVVLLFGLTFYLWVPYAKHVMFLMHEAFVLLFSHKWLKGLLWNLYSKKAYLFCFGFGALLVCLFFYYRMLQAVLLITLVETGCFLVHSSRGRGEKQVEWQGQWWGWSVKVSVRECLYWVDCGLMVWMEVWVLQPLQLRQTMLESGWVAGAVVAQITLLRCVRRKPCRSLIKCLLMCLVSNY